MTEIVLASGNRGKHAELLPLFAEHGFTLRPQDEFGVGPGPEDAPTFVENALSKARHVAKATGRAVLADDSGLCVAALSGAPGVHSALYAGEHGNDAANNALLLERLAGVEDRRAYFCCVLVLLRHTQDPLPLIAEGRWEGSILEAPRGEGGFGYDPLFLDPASGKAAAELAREKKSAISHRGRAVAALTPLLAALAAR